MKVIAVVGGPEADTRPAVEALATDLAERGSVATVARLADHPTLEAAGAAAEDLHRRVSTRVGLANDGVRVTAGAEADLEGTLADLAPEHDYAVLEGFPDGEVPTVALGDVDPAGAVLQRADSVEDLDLDAVPPAIEDVEPFVTLESLVAEAKRSEKTNLAGAIATFTGRVREREDPADTPTERLEFERYDEVARDRLQAIREELSAREGVYEALAYHRTGVVEAGEDIVFVVVLAGHRREAFETVSDGIDRLKAEVPLFKKEVTVDEEFWRHERPSG
jgi:molybdopterin synthase catalytic subunit